MTKEDTTQPDPAWDYYEIWHSLHHIKARIDKALSIIHKAENANAETNEEARKILDLASDKLIDLISSIRV